MAIQCKTRGNVNPKGRQKVYFTCHPSDFCKYSDEVMDKVLEMCDCAIWYYPKGEVSDFDDLSGMTLFIVLVTKRFLTEQNSAFFRDYMYAVERHIPILPILMDEYIDALFFVKCGSKQYLEWRSADKTKLSVDEKLKKFLDNVVLRDEVIKRIKNSFDAYVFLSYRKKDRKYAQELMRTIHENPRFADIAIWYDEYLSIGEDYNIEIEENMSKSKLFVLTVTPNLLEIVNGEPNYVARIEYPMARKCGKRVLPVEMEITDKSALSEMYDGLPEVVDCENVMAILKELLKISSGRDWSHFHSSEHAFLIGLAYLRGIDVELDTKKAISLLTESAQCGYPDAIDLLIDMYENGKNVTVDYNEAIKWRKKAYDLMVNAVGETHPDTLGILGGLADGFRALGNYEKALELTRRCYKQRIQVLGPMHADTLSSLNDLAVLCLDLGRYKEALKLNSECYEKRVRVLGKEHPDTWFSLSNLASCYSSLKDYESAFPIKEKCYEEAVSLFGKEHPKTLELLNNLANGYRDMGNQKKAFELCKECYEKRSKVLGDDHPDTLISLNNLANMYSDLGDYEKSHELKQECYKLMVRVLGSEHPDTLLALNNLANSYSDMGDYEIAIELARKCYEARIHKLGEEHPLTIQSLHILSKCHHKIGDYKKAIELGELCYKQSVNVLGENDSLSLTVLSELAVDFGKTNAWKKSYELSQKAYEIRLATLGQEQEDTLYSLFWMGVSLMNMGEYDEALKMFITNLDAFIRILGNDHPFTQNVKGLISRLSFN